MRDHWLKRMRAISLVAVALGGVGCHRHAVAFVQHPTFLRHSIVSLSAENKDDVSKEISCLFILYMMSKTNIHCIATSYRIFLLGSRP